MSFREKKKKKRNMIRQVPSVQQCEVLPSRPTNSSETWEQRYPATLKRSKQRTSRTSASTALSRQSALETKGGAESSNVADHSISRAFDLNSIALKSQTYYFQKCAATASTCTPSAATPSSPKSRLSNAGTPRSSPTGTARRTAKSSHTRTRAGRSKRSARRARCSAMPS